MMKKALKKTMAIALAGSLLAGCSAGAQGGNSGKAAKDGTATIRVGIVTNTMGVPAAYALDQGFYKDAGLNVEPVIFSTGSLVNEAFAAGEIDVAFSGLASIFSLATGTASWIGEINTTKGLGIYVRPDSEILKHKGAVEGYENVYGDKDSVTGIKILGPLGNVAQYCSANWIGIFGLTDQDVDIVNMDYGAAYQAFISGEGDAVSINNPYTFMLDDQGYVCAATFEDATKTVLNDGIFANSKFIENNRDAMVKFIGATYKAVDELQDHDKRFDFSMKWFKENGKEYKEEEMEQEISLRQYINKDYMTQSDYMLGVGMLQIADFYVEDGKIDADSRPNIPKAIDETLINDALGITVKAPEK